MYIYTQFVCVVTCSAIYKYTFFNKKLINNFILSLEQYELLSHFSLNVDTILLRQW